MRIDLCVSVPSPLWGKRLWKLGCSPCSSTPSCRKAVPPSGGFLCHPNTVYSIFSITAYLNSHFLHFHCLLHFGFYSLPFMFWAVKGTQSVYRIPNSYALQCRVKASFHETGKSALWTPKLCQAAAQSTSVQQHLLPESSKNDCPPASAENSRQVYTSL